MRESSEITNQMDSAYYIDQMAPDVRESLGMVI